MLSETSELLAEEKLDQALLLANAALQMAPHNPAVYELRGSIYLHEKLWDRAESDYKAAEKLDPADSAFEYQLAEIKFLQKAYDDARLQFAAIQRDPRLGDLALYNMFLCDLFDGNDERASKDLNVIARTNAPHPPSYYYAHAAWEFYHGNRVEANKWFSSAAQLFDPQKSGLYIACLVQTQRVRPTIVTFAAKDGTRFEAARIFVEKAGLRVSTLQGWVTVPFTQLPEDLSTFPPEIRSEIADNRTTLEARAPQTPLTLTTRWGSHYDQVRWSVDNTGLRVLTQDGWLTIPFDQLSDDLSSFPADAQREIAAERRAATETTPGIQVLTFTTKRGRRYDQVRTYLSSSEIRLLTPDGWIAIPFAQLPDDLAPFPLDWRNQITRQKSRLLDQLSSTDLVTFISKTGKHYSQVRAVLGENGLRLLSQDGWITIPMKDLPDDESSFPEELKKALTAKRSRIAAIQNSLSSVKTNSTLSPSKQNKNAPPSNCNNIDPKPTQ